MAPIDGLKATGQAAAMSAAAFPVGWSDRWHSRSRHLSTHRARVFTATIVALAVVALTGGSAASQETAGDADAVGLLIAVAPNPPVVDEEVMLISRFIGLDEQATAESGWTFAWQIDESGPDSSLWDEPRQLVTFPTAGTYVVALTACRDDGSECLETSTEVTVTEVGTRPGTIELDVRPSVLRDGVLTATVTSPDHKILGTYFEARHRVGGNPASPPGNSPTFDVERPEHGDFTIVVAACFLSPGLVCQTAQQKIPAEPDVVDAEPTADDPTASADLAAAAEILIAPYPPVVGETVMFALRDLDGRDPSSRKTWSIDDGGPWRPKQLEFNWEYSENRYRRSATTRLTRAGTHTISVTQCEDECRVVAERTFEVATTSNRPAVDLDIALSPAEAIRDEPLAITVQAGEGTTIGETFVRLDPHFRDSGVTSRPTYVTTPERAGPATVTTAVCSAGVEPTCELVTREFFVNRPGAGTAVAPAAATDLALDLDLFEDGHRLRWTDTNELETGYRVSAGPSLGKLTLLGDYPRDTSGVYTADGDHVCFAVQAFFGELLGPRASYCQPELAADVEPYMILTLGEPVAGEPVTFRVNGMAQDFNYWAGYSGPAPEWDFGDRLVGASCASRSGCTHTFDSPGRYEVAVSDGKGATTRRTVTVAPSPSEPGVGLRAPSNIESFAQLGSVTFSDTNTGEDGYAISYDYGAWLGHTAANATSAALTESYSEYSGGPVCIEVRAFKDGVLGPASSSCDFSPGNNSDKFEVTNVAVRPGPEPGELEVTYSASVGTNMSFHHEIAAIDVNLAFHNNPAAEPRCHRIQNPLPGAFDYESGTPGVDLVRTYTTTIDGLTTGRTYAAGFAYQADRNGGTHGEWWRAETACQPHKLSLEAIAP